MKSLKKLKFLDLFPKTAEEVKQLSPLGAVVSLIGGFILILLLISEIREYSNPGTTHSLRVFVGREEKMKINFKIAFLSLPCDDKFGEDHISANKHLSMKPWRGDFRRIKESVTEGWLFGDTWRNKFWSALDKNALPGVFGSKCLPCYEAAGAAKCCNNCHELKRAFVKSGLDIKLTSNYPQCATASESDGCLVSGSIHVNKAQGSFHIAVGESHMGHGQRHHHHWPVQERQLGFNTSHYISHLSFGESYPGMENPLDDFVFIEEGLGQQQYFIQVVPTVYTSGSRVVETNQYSMTHFHNSIDLNSEHIELPGVFFKYDISPIMVHIEEKTHTFSHFLTRVCAVIGGTWVMIGMLYKALSAGLDVVKKIQ